jgi:hypothetical protein
MQVLKIKDTASSPGIILNPEDGVFLFTGRSLPEDPIDFFEPVLGWFEEYKASPIAGSKFEFKLNYFNTASSKVFFHIFQLIDEINLKDEQVNNKIIIYANSDDEDLLELFEYYQELLSSNCLELQAF